MNSVLGSASSVPCNLNYLSLDLPTLAHSGVESSNSEINSNLTKIFNLHHPSSLKLYWFYQFISYQHSNFFYLFSFIRQNYLFSKKIVSFLMRNLSLNLIHLNLFHPIDFDQYSPSPPLHPNQLPTLVEIFWNKKKRYFL